MFRDIIRIICNGVIILSLLERKDGCNCEFKGWKKNWKYIYKYVCASVKEEKEKIRDFCITLIYNVILKKNSIS